MESTEKMNEAISLLEQVKPEVETIKAKEEGKRTSGKMFNVFSVLGIDEREMKS